VADWFFNGFASELSEAIELYREIKRMDPEAPVELWQMEPNKYGCRYVVITRLKHPGPTPKIKLIRKIEVKK